MTEDRVFRGFAADGSKLYADRCTYCGMEGHRASQCKRRGDFASLIECGNCGEREPCQCMERDAGVMLDEEGRKALWFVVAVALTALAVVLVGSMVAQ